MKLTFIEKIGSSGVLLTALACPVCWPLFASIGGALGLGFLAPYESVLMVYVFPLFVSVALLGTVLSYRYHRELLPLIIGVVSALFVLVGFYINWQLTLMYVGIFGLLISSALSFRANRKAKLKCQN